jgi:ketosteroid isomerase-like protein
MNLHSRTLARITKDDGKIQTYEEYENAVRSSNDAARQNNTFRTIDFRFTQRIVATQRAYEEGIYKIVQTSPEGNKKYSYGKFFVVLIKENGEWKIMVDMDTSQGIGEKDFVGK